MKKMFLLFACLLPAFLFAQDDYCPCMESSNPYVNMMAMVDMMDGMPEDLGLNRYPVSNFASFEEEQFNERSILQEVQNQTEVQPFHLKNHIEIRASQQSKNAQSSRKKVKKKAFVRLKSRKRGNKYRGKCPKF